MPSSVRSVMAAAGLEPEGVVTWGQLINTDEPGIYVVSLGRDVDVVGHESQPAPLNEEAISTLLEVRPELTVDGARPSREELAQRLAEFWLPDEHILYIGLATDLHDRVNQYFGTPLGARRPHAGGWFLKTIVGVNETFVHWARTYDRVAAEGAALEAFVSSVSKQTREQLRDPEHPFPFANLEWPAGTRKRHGIKGAKAPRVRMPGTESGTRGNSGSGGRAPASPLRPPQLTRAGEVVTQRVTAADLNGGRVRIPRAGKHLFPTEAGLLRLRLRGSEVQARWDPRMGPPERSGVLSIGRGPLSAAVSPDEVLRVSSEGDGYELN